MDSDERFDLHTFFIDLNFRYGNILRVMIDINLDIDGCINKCSYWEIESMVMYCEFNRFIYIDIFLFTSY